MKASGTRCWQNFKPRCIRFFELEAFCDEFSKYWTVYGGIRAVAKSPWLWLSFIFTLIVFPYSSGCKWADAAFGIIPALLGFTIGAMAIVLAFPTGPVFKFLAEDGRPDSYYIDIAAKFLHFILVQTFALGMAAVSKAYPSAFVNLLGYCSLSYAILTGVATGFSLFGVAIIYNLVPPDGAKPPSSFDT